jgi:hypothetical protein
MPDRVMMPSNALLCTCAAATLFAAAGDARALHLRQDNAEKRDKAEKNEKSDRSERAPARQPSLPVREIERRVIPRVPGAQYLGFDFDPGSDIYTLKFLRNGSVIWVDVEGRTGNIVRSTGN